MSNPANDAVITFLAATSSKEVRKLATENTPEALKDYLVKEWMREDPSESLAPDSAEAAEAAEVDADQEEAACAAWVRLSPAVRGKVLEAARQMGADEDLESDLNWAVKEAQFDKEIREIEEAGQSAEKWEAYKKAHPEKAPGSRRAN